MIFLVSASHWHSMLEDAGLQSGVTSVDFRWSAQNAAAAGRHE
jgi:hypothetical protein